MKKRTLTLALVLTLGLGTAGCGSGTPSSAPTAPSSEDPSADPSPAPTPTEQAEPEPEPEPERIVITAEAIRVLASDGTELAAYDYFQDTADVVDGLTELFGRPPADTPVAGDAHAPAGIERGWDGFAILDDEREAVEPHTPNHLVSVTAGEVDGITVETADGFTVGTSAEEVLASSDAESYPDTGIIQVDPIPLDFDDPACPEGGCTLSVRLLPDESGAAITRMLAPAPNFGP